MEKSEKPDEKQSVDKTPEKNGSTNESSKEQTADPSKQKKSVKILSVLLIITTFLLMIAISYIVYDYSLDQEFEEQNSKTTTITNTKEAEENNPNEELAVDKVDESDDEKDTTIDKSDWETYTEDSTSNDPINTRTWVFSEEVPGTFTPAETNIPVKISLMHPGGWENVNDYEFADSEGNKVFIYTGGGLVLLEGNSCFGNLDEVNYGISGTKSVLVSQEDEMLGDNDVVVRIEEVEESAIGPFYDHKYCVKYNENALYFNFVERDMETNGERSDIFDAVIESLQITD